MLKTDSLKKTERIAAAAYLITGYFDSQEPLKWSIRTVASELVSLAVFVKDNLLMTEEDILSDMRRNALELAALFTVARQAGLVSEMNHEIFAKEIDKFVLSLSLSGSEVSHGGAPVLSEHFFEIAARPAASVPGLEMSKTVKDKFSESDYAEPVFERPRVEAPRRSEEPKERTLREFGAVAVKKNSRQSVIINLLKRKKEIMIKDVTPLIEGVSEKTIQRELLAMVKQGILKKEGEKRWSRYTLAAH